MKSLKIGCFGDDFTGSSDAASFIRKGGLRTIMLTKLPSDDEKIFKDVEAVVISLKTRNVHENEAISISKEVYEWFNKNGFEHIYFKYCSTFDSTEKGNIGPVADMLLEESQQKYTILCPALPVNGRTVHDGRLFVNGVLLENSHMRNHPLTPMRRSSVKELIEMQSQHKAYNITREVLEDNTRLKDYIDKISEAQKHAYLIPDYENYADGEIIARTFRHLKVLTGGSGLLQHLSKCYSENVTNNNDIELNVQGRAILIAGSCSKVTLNQIDKYKTEGGYIFKLDIDKIISERELYLQELVAIMNKQESNILFYSSDDFVEVEKYQKKYGRDNISENLETFSAEVAFEAMNMGYTKLIAAGGETSGAIIQKLDYNSFHVLDDAEPGIPIMAPTNNNNVRIVLKSGSFGSDNFFTDTIKKLEKEED